MSTAPNTIPAGASRLRRFLADSLAEHMPPLIEAAREQLGLEPHMMPMPVRYDAYDPLSANQFPVIGAYINRSADWNRVDINEYAEEVYEARFSIGVFVWVRTPELNGQWATPSYDQALRLRDDMMSLLRSALLAWPGLGSDGVAALDEGTVSEDYPDAIKANDQSSRWLAGGNINCEIRVREANYTPSPLTVETVVVETGLLQEVEDTP